MSENVAGAAVQLSPDELGAIANALAITQVHRERYPEHLAALTGR